MGNYLVGIFKDTPLLSTIGVAELFHAATAVGGYNYRYLEPYTLVGIIFLTLSNRFCGENWLCPDHKSIYSYQNTP